MRRAEKEIGRKRFDIDDSVLLIQIMKKKEHCCHQDLQDSRPQQGKHHIGQLVARSLLSAWSNSYDRADSENEGSCRRI